MSRMLLGTAMALAIAVPAQAARPPSSLGVRAFTLTRDHSAKKANVGVDASGTGHFVWDVSNPSGDDPLVYCRVPRGTRHCQRTQTFPLPLESFGEPQVLIDGSRVILIADRCCGPDNDIYAVVSSDGGTTFAAPVIVGNVTPGQAVLWPGSGLVTLADDVVTGGVHFQATTTAGPVPGSSALLGSGAGDYDGTIGFATQTAPLFAYDDLAHGFWRAWSGSGDVNDASSWGPVQALGALHELRMASGPAGVVLMAKRHRDSPFYDQYVARRFNAATSTWRSAFVLSNRHEEPDVIFRDTFEDQGGHVAAVWVANGTHGHGEDPIRYRVSPDGGASWRAERTLVGNTHGVAFNLQTGAAPDGGGFVAWDANDAGPLKAVPIPKLSAQR